MAQAWDLPMYPMQPKLLCVPALLDQLNLDVHTFPSSVCLSVIGTHENAADVTDLVRVCTS